MQTITGNFLWAIDATSRANKCLVAMQTQQSANIPFKQGQFIDRLSYSRLYVTNETAVAGGSISFLYGLSEDNQGINIENPADSLTGVEIETPNAMTSTGPTAIAAGVATLIASASATRKTLIISSDPSSAGATYLHEDSGTTNDGILLMPGQTITLSYNSTLYAYNAAAGSNTIATSSLALT